MKSNERIKSEMYGIVTRWQTSGMKQKDFCRSEGINYYKFKYWKTQYTREHEFIQQKQGSKESRDFIPIEIPSQESLFSGIELTFPNGVKLTVNQSISSHEIKNLLELY